jgi:hypothetical protein
VLGYLEWAQRVLRVVLEERPASFVLTLPRLAAEVGFSLSERPDREQKAITLSLDHVLRDLTSLELLVESPDGAIHFRPEARLYRTEPLETLWPQIAQGFLDPTDEAYLVVLGRLSEQPSSPPDVSEVPSTDVFETAGWDWDRHRSLAVEHNLFGLDLIAGRAFPERSFLRVTYKGLVRTTRIAEPGKLPLRRSRRRGRPRGSRAVTRDQIVTTFHGLRRQYGRDPTQAELCAHLNPRIEVRTLKDALDAYGLPWPL